ncbi:MAG: hypothetical protein GWP12_02310 [Nitrospirae bacterium]|nr:hypothetical protein [Nitrospirota bacterium]
MPIPHTVLDLIGKTPMVRINKLVGDSTARVLAKLQDLLSPVRCTHSKSAYLRPKDR